ncbi:hypothetical protein HW130_18675 [Streptomyces sp. PKU-EA00015]|uniref:hypothetical protein n=1 Tax=Streptomyces sp. PKU-EA00015 TaxID=2748326 RepID=UPI0015A46093|nr:hypothetical protein [Streptomyces sp. PKU-EA00015]NWF28269.1 hypothetical protein [Streptomyces sp. PKU-EA00015]
MTAITFEEVAERERLIRELGRFDLSTAAGQGLDELGYDDDKGWFVGRRVS